MKIGFLFFRLFVGVGGGLPITFMARWWLAGAVLLFSPSPVWPDAWLKQSSRHFVVYSEAADSRIAQDVLDRLETVYNRVTVEIGHTPQGMIRVLIAGSSAAFDSLTHRVVPTWGIGVAFPGSHTIVLKSPRLTLALDDILETAIHEFAHIALADALGPNRSAPRWFDEGLAMFAAKDWRLWQRYPLTLAVLTNNLIPLQQIESVNTFATRKAQLAYLESASTIEFILLRYGSTGLRQLVEQLQTQPNLEWALQAAFGIGLVAFENHWMAHLRQHYGLFALVGENRFVLWTGLALLFVVAYLIKQRQARHKLSEWKAEEFGE